MTTKVDTAEAPFMNYKFSMKGAEVSAGHICKFEITSSEADGGDDWGVTLTRGSPNGEDVHLVIVPEEGDESPKTDFSNTDLATPVNLMNTQKMTFYVKNLDAG